MKTTYFLFGKDASEILIEEGFEELIDRIENEEDVDFSLYKFDSKTNPAEFLSHFQNWGDYCVISKEEHEKLGSFLS